MFFTRTLITIHEAISCALRKFLTESQRCISNKVLLTTCWRNFVIREAILKINPGLNIELSKKKTFNKKIHVEFTGQMLCSNQIRDFRRNPGWIRLKITWPSFGIIRSDLDFWLLPISPTVARTCEWVLVRSLVENRWIQKFFKKKSSER